MQELLSNNPALVALVSTLFGGAGLKVVESWLGRARERASEASSLRDELRKELESLRTQLEKSDVEERRLETLVDDWRSKYYDLRDEKQKVVTELTITLDRLKSLEARLDKIKDN